MAYQVIARKWRPQAFSEVVGQNHITQTLLNALKNGRLPHALLFTGPRGTGKTSSARILAKALRCPNAVDFVPCGKCDSCTEIATSSSVDVIEIDGASNNGVDAIRELRDTVAFMPSSGSHKVYIIDEVHMLSTSAFNALLKTLEEPPAHVIFIMATTEAHKIPQTILSRCQRFDFRRITTKQITERLRLICETDGLQAEEDALWIIARQGDGSMRDSQSLLDQVITFANGPLTKANVVEILGLTDHSLLLETLESLIERNNSGILAILEKLATSGVEPSLFAQELLETIRNLLIVKVSGTSSSEILEVSDSEFAHYQELAKRLPEEDIHMLFDMALKGAQDLARSQDARLVLEVTLLRMVSAPKIASLKEILTAVLNGTALSPAPAATPVGLARRPEPQAPKVAAGHQRLKEAQKVSEVPRGLEAMKKAIEQKPAPNPASNKGPAAATQTSKPLKAQGANAAEKWIHFVDLVRQDDALFAAKIENLLFIKESDRLIHLGVPPKLVFLKEQMADTQVRKKLQGYIDSLWGDGYSFQVNTDPAKSGQSAQALVQQKHQLAEDEVKKQIAEHPAVKAATKAFKGQIKSVTEIKS
ncbi:MAG: DNA polymerase III subunit gamma/tau [Bdellovibrionia bacterium]